ncbi:hypothetical protein CPC08DRAFT_428884 [Agrocybe pediades]|nr:hypothetical protein CPC08DRAFT_428884 [Agrocybe pediades]
MYMMPYGLCVKKYMKVKLDHSDRPYAVKSLIPMTREHMCRSYIESGVLRWRKLPKMSYFHEKNGGTCILTSTTALQKVDFYPDGVWPSKIKSRKKCQNSRFWPFAALPVFESRQRLLSLELPQSVEGDMQGIVGSRGTSMEAIPWPYNPEGVCVRASYMCVFKMAVATNFTRRLPPRFIQKLSINQ